MDTDAASQPIGFFPRFPPPPKYIRVRAHNKKEKTFSRVFVAQELEGATGAAGGSDKDDSVSFTGVPNEASTGKAIWALVFSNDGKYLAAAGQDKKVRVWQVVGSPEDRDPADPASDSDDGPPRLNAQVFKSRPVQVYEGHTGSVLDLSWSKVLFTGLSKFESVLTQTSRTTSCSLRQWTRRSDSGM